MLSHFKLHKTSLSQRNDVSSAMTQWLRAESESEHIPLTFQALKMHLTLHQKVLINPQTASLSCKGNKHG